MWVIYTHQPAQIGHHLKYALVTLIATLTFGIGTAHAAQAPQIVPEPLSVALRASDRVPQPTIRFQHGNIDWLPELAAQAGWPPKTWVKLGQIILRESGGCPNRKGGDIVNKDCEITGIAERTHQSDTGLLQLNAVTYRLNRNQWAPICLAEIACTQEPLLDPLTNLKAGLVLFKIAGWDPWTPPPGG